MGTTGNRRIGRALTLAVGVATVALPIYASAPASAEPPPPLTGTISDSVDLASLPAHTTLSLPKIDPTAVDVFALTGVTITATLESSLTGHLENLSSTHPKTLTVVAHVDLAMAGDALSSTLQAGQVLTDTVTVPAGGTAPIDLADSDEFTEVVDQAALLDALYDVLVGEADTIDFDVDGVVDTSVNGPAPYLSTGVTSGRASVTIDYEYVETCPHDPELPADDPDCVPPPPPPPPPPAECVDWDFKVDPVVPGDTAIPGGGTFTVTDVYDGTMGEAFDWASTVPVAVIAVKGGPQAIPREEFVYDPPATSGTGLHAPLNPHSGSWYGLSHLEVCLARESETNQASLAAVDPAESDSPPGSESKPDKPDKPEPKSEQSGAASEPTPEPQPEEPAPEPEPAPQAQESGSAGEQEKARPPEKAEKPEEPEPPEEPDSTGGEETEAATVGSQDKGDQ